MITLFLCWRARTLSLTSCSASGTIDQLKTPYFGLTMTFGRLFFHNVELALFLYQESHIILIGELLFSSNCILWGSEINYRNLFINFLLIDLSEFVALRSFILNEGILQGSLLSFFPQTPILEGVQNHSQYWSCAEIVYNCLNLL